MSMPIDSRRPPPQPEGLQGRATAWDAGHVEVHCPGPLPTGAARACYGKGDLGDRGNEVFSTSLRPTVSEGEPVGAPVFDLRAG